MDTIKTTYKEFFDMLTSFQAIVNVNEKGQEIKDKLSYACYKLSSGFTAKVKLYKSEIDKLNITLCEVDEKGRVIEKDGRYQYTKENLEKRRLLMADWDNKEIEISVYPVKVSDCARIKELQFHILDRLNGILFEVNPEDYVDQKPLSKV